MRLKINKVILSTLRPKRNGYHNSDDSFLNKNVWISIKIPLKFVLLCLINNIAALVQIMTWRRSGDKPLSEPMMVSLLTHICVTQPEWVEWKVFWFRNTISNSRSCQCRHICFFLLLFGIYVYDQRRWVSMGILFIMPLYPFITFRFLQCVLQHLHTVRVVLSFVVTIRYIYIYIYIYTYIYNRHTELATNHCSPFCFYYRAANMWVMGGRWYFFADSGMITLITTNWRRH